MTEKPTTADVWDGAFAAFEETRGEGSPRLLRMGDPEVAYERCEFLDRQPWRVFALQVEQRVLRARTEKRLRWTSWLAGLGFILSTAVAAVVFYSPEMPSSVIDIRTKGVGGTMPLGHAGGSLFLEVGGQPVDSHSVLSAGSEISFSVDTVGYDHVFVVGEESSGTLTPYYPDAWEGISILVGVGTGISLPDSVQLDESTGMECMIALFSTSPLTGGDVRSIIRGTSAKAEGMTLERVCFEKRP